MHVLGEGREDTHGAGPTSAPGPASHGWSLHAGYLRGRGVREPAAALRSAQALVSSNLVGYHLYHSKLPFPTTAAGLGGNLSKTSLFLSPMLLIAFL